MIKLFVIVFFISISFVPIIHARLNDNLIVYYNFDTGCNNECVTVPYNNGTGYPYTPIRPIFVIREYAIFEKLFGLDKTVIM